ncbi:hypothetical protein JHK82_055050 [Glycine max]|nr:hypothetical protein JHK86_054888 [Glycine max]KAG4909012.1 hypothetical protein JHK87_055128 [Glycine soja]KAG4917575.1 hypothetical protein JHK85_055856 [Glycine max]KAG5073683.1 hypothetical protein JHK84_054914 [Glycine max]KAG5076355.1 hypothetical protein JHK82_055050 [Glycine max]
MSSLLNVNSSLAASNQHRHEAFRSKEKIAVLLEIFCETRAFQERVELIVAVLMNILSTRGVLEQGACLDALISLMVDSSSNQMSYLLHITLICFMILILFSIYKLLHL